MRSPAHTLRCLVPALTLLLGACASAPDAGTDASTTTVAVEGYAGSFARAKDALREAGFTLDRIDARAGVITTDASASVGFFTPWIDHHATARDAWMGLVHREQRTARVTFSPASGEDVADLRSYEGPLQVDVRVEVERIEQPGRRYDASGLIFAHRSPGSIGDAGISIAPVASPVRVDESLAERIRIHVD